MTKKNTTYHAVWYAREGEMGLAVSVHCADSEQNSDTLAREKTGTTKHKKDPPVDTRRPKERLKGPPLVRATS